METNYSILLFPWLAHGHVVPYLELAKNLAKKNFQVYLCSTPVNLSSISNDDELNSSAIPIQFVEFHLSSSIADLPQQYHTTKNTPPHLLSKLHEALAMSKSSFFDILSSLRPHLLIYDVFTTWAVEQATSLGITSIHFATTGAAAYSFYYHRMSKDSPFPNEAIYLRDSERRVLHASISYLTSSKGDQDTIFNHFALSRDIILMKTSRGFEGKYIDYLSDLCKKKVVPVGALVAQPAGDDEIIDWLSKKKQFSTVFISLGSENYFTRKQLTEIAKGLENSDANFIWVIRSPHGENTSVKDALPDGFFDTVKDRGIILEKWAPQARILAHSSTGAFVSHCGASSIIESVYFGTPVIALPLKLDQPINARLVVDCGVGLEIERDENGDFSRESVTKAINEVILERRGEEMRLKASELGLKMKAEQEPATNEAAEILMQLCNKGHHHPSKNV